MTVAGDAKLWVCLQRDALVVVTVGPLASAVWLPEGIVATALVERHGSWVAAAGVAWIVQPVASCMDLIRAYHADRLPWRDGSPSRFGGLRGADPKSWTDALHALRLDLTAKSNDASTPSPPGGRWTAGPGMGEFAGEVYSGYEIRVSGVGGASCSGEHRP